MSSVPSAIGRFHVLRRIARGGMGTLYLAWDPKLDRQIAIKVLTDDNDDLRERFAREARSAARLHHPHIVTIFDVGEHDGEPFIAMEYVQGETLAAIIRNRVPLTTSRKLEIIEQLGEGLAYAHKVGVIHRDVKPANIMIALDGTVKILDFGIARIGVASSSMTIAGMLMGTLSYMSPEQAAGQTADNRSDVFAVGAVLYELLSFQQAFPGGFGDGILHRVMYTAPPAIEQLCPGLDPEIVRVVNKALEKDPAQRYQDLAAMSSEIRRIRSRLPEEPPVVGSTDPTLPPVIAATRPAFTPQPSRRGADREELERRRTKQIEEHLAAARDALVSGAYDAAITACEQVLMIDAENERAIEILDRARAILDERQAEEWLAEAEQEIERGALTSALAKIDRAAAIHSSPRAGQLRKIVDEAMAARERARQRAEALRRHLDHAQELFDKGAFQDAVAAAEAALELDPGQSEALDVKARAIDAIEAHQRELLERRARDAVREARRLFAADDHAGALDRLERFEPPHELVASTLEQLKAEAARIAAQRRLDAERRARRELIDAEMAFARVEIDAHDFAAALQRLRALDAGEVAPAVEALIRDAEAGQKADELAAQRAAEVAEHIARSAGLLARHDFEGALTRVDAALELAPDHKAARALRAKIESRLRAVAEQRAAEEARKRERDEAVARAIAAARETTNHQAAIAALREALDLDPDHQEAQKLLASRQELLAREEAERARHQQIEAARRKEILQLMSDARHAADREDFAAARQAVHRVIELDPAHGDARVLSDEIDASEAAARRQAPPAATTIFVPPAQAGAAVTVPAPEELKPAPARSVPAPAPTPIPAPVATPPPPATIASEKKQQAPAHPPSKVGRIYWLGGALTAVAAVVLMIRVVGPGTRVSPNANPTTAATPRPADGGPGSSTPSPPAAAAAAPPAASPRPSPAVESARPAEPNADDVRQSAREQLARGQREQGLDTLANGLKKWPDDAQLKAMMSAALVDARSRLKTAHDAANKAGTAASRLPDYRDALRREQQVTTLARAGRSEEAVRASWAAADLFTRAAATAKTASAEARPAAPSSTPPPAASTPPRVEPRVEPTPPPAPTVSQPPPTQSAPQPATPTPTPAAPETAAPERPAPQPPPVAAPQVSPPAASARPPSPSPPRPPADEPMIRRVLQEYADAYSRLDAGAVKRLFPSVNEQALRQNFAATKSQQVQIQNETIAVNGTTATASFTWVATFTGQVGGVQRASPKVVLRLQKTGDNWVIVERR